MWTKRFFAAAAVLAIAGCSLDKQTAPPLVGPSELGLSLLISATPDSIQQDGSSSSSVEVFVRDANSQPVRGVVMNAQTRVGPTVIDYGRLSTKTISTNADGKATLVYTAPPAPSPTVNSDSVVTIEFIPVSANFASAVDREVEIQLRRPGVIIPPGDGPVASFFFSPNAPRSEDDVFFDGSASTGDIVTYVWDFGDGRTGSGKTTRHHYELPGTYNVVLKVIDDKGRTNTSAPKPLTVAALVNPTADFVFSPTTPKQNTVVNFDALLSKAEVGHSIATYTWDFGDNGQLFQTSSPTTQRIYAVGTYTVTLQVTDDVGRKGTVAKTITVAP